MVAQGFSHALTLLVEFTIAIGYNTLITHIYL